MNNKPWYRNNTLEKFQEGTYDFLGHPRDDKDYTETWWFKKPFRFQIEIGDGQGLDNVITDPTRWHKSLAKLENIFNIEGDYLVIPAGTQLDFKNITSNDEAWHYLNEDPSLEIPITADMWNYEISPIIGKKLSDAEKQARKDKAAQNKLNSKDNKRLYRVGDVKDRWDPKGKYLVAVDSGEEIYSLKVIRSTKEPHGNLFFLSREAAETFKDNFKNSYGEYDSGYIKVISVSIPEWNKQYIFDNLVSIKTNCGEALMIKNDEIYIASLERLTAQLPKYLSILYKEWSEKKEAELPSWSPYRKVINKIIIPPSVTSISDYAFYGFTDLTSIEIPNSVTRIGVSAFYGCKNLTIHYQGTKEQWQKIKGSDKIKKPIVFEK